MKLDFMEEFSGSNGHTIVKRKRSKRQRPSSSASSNGGTDFCNSSPTTSTEQDQDMANCLILLAQGNSPQQPQDAITSAPDTKFTSRKFTAMAAGKLGIYVYDFKKFNRIFPSFQALGGHRASHKKPKTTTDDDRKRPPPSAAALGCPDVAEQRLSPPNSPQFLAGICRNDQNKPRIHECSICGSEFGSGQALGGHMRRHRPAGSSTENDTTSSDDVGVKARNMLALDLNLPAPVDEEFGQFPAKQQPRLVFSAAPLVGCHY